MPDLHFRAAEGAHDLERAARLVLANPDAHPHLVDLPFRLASTHQDENCDFGLWETQNELRAWAVFQPAWWNLDYAMHPVDRGGPLEDEVFAWGFEQARALALRQSDSFDASVELLQDGPRVSETIRRLERHGFAPFDWSIVRFEVSLHEPVPDAVLPKGYTIRPLAGEREVDAYVALHRAAFGSERMTAPWRRRTLERPEYVPGVDLVAIAPDGSLAGFCVGWLADVAGRRLGQIEPLGVHPDHQRAGLGRVLELECLRALRMHGAVAAFVDHISLNAAAIEMSRSNGFRRVNNALRYFRTVP